MKKLVTKLSCVVIFALLIFCVFSAVINLQSNQISLKQPKVLICSNSNNINVNHYSNLADAITSITTQYKIENYDEEIETNESLNALNKKFGTKRLLVEVKDESFNMCGAIAASRYENFFILQYATTIETRAAYEYYLSLEYNVAIDSVYDLPETEVIDVENSIIKLQEEAKQFYSWGAEEMGVSHRFDYLESIIKAENNDIKELPEVVVAVLDTGIDTDHPWFKNRLLKDKNGKIIGRNHTNEKDKNSYSFEDYDGHGTHCAGIICDLTLLNVKILPIKVMGPNANGERLGTTFGVLAGLNSVNNMRNDYNIVAVNMSLHISDEEDYITFLFQACIANLKNKGITCVVAAGNDGNISNQIPAKIINAVTVGALDEDLTLANYSNYGASIDVCAPGTDIESAYINGRIVLSSGTSSAAPHISAYIALLKSDPLSKYSFNDIKDILVGDYYNPYEEQYCYTVRNLGRAGKDIFYGYGLPNFFGFLRSYQTIDLCSDAFGKISPSGYNLYFSKTTSLKIPIKFYPNEGYYQSMFLANGRRYENVTKMTEYTFKTSRLHEQVRVTFVKGYIINHYLESLNPISNNYQLNDSQICIGELQDLSTIKPKAYQGFSTMTMEHKLIGESNVVNIYYKRNQYNITINYNYNGKINSIVKTVSYGENLDLNLSTELGYKLKNVVCNGNELNLCDASYNLENITSDLEVTVNLTEYEFSDMNLCDFILCLGIGLLLVFVLMKIVKPRTK